MNDGPAAVFAVPVRALAGTFEDDITTKVGAVAHVEDEGVVDLVEARIEARRAEAQLEVLPVAVSVELEGVPALDVQRGARAGGCAEFEGGDAVGERDA